MVNVRFSEREKRFLELLRDGKRYETKFLVIECIEGATGDDDPELWRSYKKTFFNMVSRLRMKLERRGMSVICEYSNRKFYYRWVKLISHE